jgi:endonuclease/exonuclease/phosphatase family metal-dependent hydrolase
MNFRVLQQALLPIIFMAFSHSLCADSFRLVTYNILSDDFVQGGVYDAVSPAALDWDHRLDKIVQRLKSLEPDVICLQELNTGSFAYFKEALSGYESSFAKKGSSSDEGVGTFCKANVFKEASHRAVLCEGTSNCGCSAVQPALFTTLVLSNDKAVTLVNTKIKASVGTSPSGPSWNHVQCIIKSIPQSAAIVVGDFNMSSDHPFMGVFYSAGLNDPFSSAPSFYENGVFQRTDYILTTSDLENTSLMTSLGKAGMPIPNEEEPSDHLPLASVIAYE